MIHLRLYVTGEGDGPRRAEAALRAICAGCGQGPLTIEVIDVLDDPKAAETARVYATPTVVRVGAGPQRRFIGDLADAERLLRVLDLL